MNGISFDALRAARLDNNRAALLLATYVSDYARTITPEMMAEICDGGLSSEFCYKLLLAGFCGLDTERSVEDKELFRGYFDKSVHELSAAAYRTDPYYAGIRIPRISFGDWELYEEIYAPFEAFVCRDLTLTPEMIEIPHIGYFPEEFRFPAVMQNGREWMAVKPNEIETMRIPLETVRGRVATLGLGLGYFAFMASEKNDVEHITVVERDRKVIELFKRYILPQFPHDEKVEVVARDAFDYTERALPHGDFDYLFADLWHDASDGLDMYLRLKRLEHLTPRTRFLYWVEPSLLSALRWRLFDGILSSSRTPEDARRRLSDDSLRMLAAGSGF